VNRIAGETSLPEIPAYSPAARDADQQFLRESADMGTERSTSASAENVYKGRDRATVEVRWTAPAVDRVFGSKNRGP
jgi:catalase (peroxidase I)